jgi:uncharacterized membrane protein
MLYRLSVFFHVVAACCWVGGLLFFALVLVPALRGSRHPLAGELVRAVGFRFRFVGWISVVVLVVTGLVNLSYRAPFATLAEPLFWLSDFGRLLALKLGLVLLMVVTSVLHDRVGARASAAVLREPAARSTYALRRAASRLGRAVAVLALAIVFVAVLLVRGSG